MTRRSDGPPTRAGLRASLTPEGTFVIQLRADSDVPRRRLSGRVEHLMSGSSAPFTSLAGLLAFMGRHSKTERARRSGTAAPDEEDRHGR